MTAILARWAEEDLGVTASSLDYVCAWLERGGTLLELTDELSAATGERISRDMLTRYLRAEWGEEGATQLARAREEGASAAVDDAQAIVDSENATREDIQRASKRADIRLWRAEREGRARYGKQEGPSVSISIGSLHLDALRTLGSGFVGPSPSALPLAEGLTRHLSAGPQVQATQEVSPTHGA